MYKHRTTQAHVCVTESSAAAAALQMFLNGIPVQVRSSLLPLSLLLVLRCVFFVFFNFLIPICNSDPRLIRFFFSGGGKPVGKHGAARGYVTFGRAAHPLAEMY